MSLYDKYVRGTSNQEEEIPSGGSSNLYRKYVFPPPPRGSIPQAEVFPEEPSLLDKFPLSDTARENIEVGKETVRNIGGMAAAPLQAARHPIASALDIPVSFARGTMGLANLLIPGQLPGTEAVERADEYLKGRISGDAPFEEAGQYAAAVPDLASIAGPLGGVTRIRPVAKALESLPGISKLVKPSSARPIKESLQDALGAGQRGRDVLESTLPREEMSQLMDVILTFPNAEKALPYIDNPTLAPNPMLRTGATMLHRARAKDVSNWDNLSRNAQDVVKYYGKFEKPGNPLLNTLAASLKSSPFHSGAPQAPQLQNLGVKAQSFTDKIMDTVHRIQEGGFTRAGARVVLAGKVADKEAKHFLKVKMPEFLQRADAYRRSEEAGHEFFKNELTDSIIRVTGSSDPKVVGGMMRSALKFVKSRQSTGSLPAEVEQAAKDWINYFDDVKKEGVTRGVYPPREAKRWMQRGDVILGRVLQAAHDPNYIETRRGDFAWKKLIKLIKRWNPGISDGEVTGQIEQLVNKETAKSIEENWRIPRELLRQTPGGPVNPLANVPERALASNLIPILGRVKRLDDAAEIAGSAMARVRAERLVKGEMIEGMRQVGMASGTPFNNWIDIKPDLKLDRPTFVPPELAETFKEAAPAVQEMHWLMRKVMKFGARFRAVSTVYSPTAQVQAPVGNLGAAVMNGTAFHPSFPSALKFGLRQAGSAIARGGQPRLNQPFERAMAMRSMSVGTQAGELGTIYTQLGMSPKIRKQPPVASWLTKIPGIDQTSEGARQLTTVGRRIAQGARQSFEQGDILFKRAVSAIHASEMSDMLDAATPGDQQRIFQGLWGSTNAGEIAATMTNNETQSYNNLSPAVKYIGSKSPVAGLFSAFAYESNRNFAWGVRYLGRELHSAAIAESPVVRQMMLKRAMRRFVGMSAGMGFLKELGNMAEDAIGPDMSDEQKEAFNQLVLPEWDRGPNSILRKEGSKISYAPASNLEYFQNTRRLLEHAGALVGAAARGEWNRVDDAAVNLLNRLGDDMLQWQQPGRGMAEFLLNRRATGSPVSEFFNTLQGKRAVPLSKSPITSQNIAERAAKGLYPGVAGTPIRQFTDIVTGERGLKEVTPIFRVKDVDTLEQMKIAGSRYADEKQNTFNARIAEIMRDKTTSRQEKAREIAKLRQDWNDDFGPKLAHDLPLWRRLHSPYEILDAMKELGHASAGPAMNGRVPDFYQVFDKAIPGDVKFYVRGER